MLSQLENPLNTYTMSHEDSSKDLRGVAQAA